MIFQKPSQQEKSSGGLGGLGGDKARKLQNTGKKIIEETYPDNIIPSIPDENEQYFEHGSDQDDDDDDDQYIDQEAQEEDQDDLEEEAQRELARTPIQYNDLDENGKPIDDSD